MSGCHSTVFYNGMLIWSWFWSCCWGPSSVYLYGAFRVIAVAFGFMCCFPCALAQTWPCLMVDWTQKHLTAFWGEAVKLSACLSFVSRSPDWQRWTDRWSSRPQNSKLNNPMMTSSRDVLSGKWIGFGKWESVHFSPFCTFSHNSLCGSSVTLRLMRVYWGLLSCLPWCNRDLNEKQYWAWMVELWRRIVHVVNAEILLRLILLSLRTYKLRRWKMFVSSRLSGWTKSPFSVQFCQRNITSSLKSQSNRSVKL